MAMPYIFSIQHLRGFAASLVVIFHAVGHLGNPEQAYGVLAEYGRIGVDIFFVISGFVMWLIALKTETTRSDFLIHRAIRIFPLYWFFTLAVIAVALAVPSAFRYTTLEPDHVLKSFLLLPAQHPKLPGIHPVLLQGWTLEYEVFFYLVFSLFLPLSGGRRLLGILAALGALFGLGLAIAPQSEVGRVYTSPLLLEFAGGLMLGYLYTRNAILGPVAGGLLAVLFVVSSLPGGAFVEDGLSRAFWWGGPSVLLVYGMLCLERRRGLPDLPFLKLLGDASYSLYLSHLFALGAVRLLWKGAPEAGSVDGIAYVATCLAAAVMLGVASHVFIQKPMLKACRRLAERARGSAVRRQVSRA
ncbi:MAG TPA: acyltransferase [Azospirillum sp.]|nr:acyltransferase [Azospirillum sp.]